MTSPNRPRLSQGHSFGGLCVQHVGPLDVARPRSVRSVGSTSAHLRWVTKGRTNPDEEGSRVVGGRSRRSGHRSCGSRAVRTTERRPAPKRSEGRSVRHSASAGSDAQVTAIAAAYGVRNSYPVAGQPFATAYPGDEYVVAHASYCAGPSGLPGLVSQDFHLTVQDGRSVGGRGDYTEKQPDLGGVQVLKAGRCARGYIAFEYREGHGRRTESATTRAWVQTTPVQATRTTGHARRRSSRSAERRDRHPWFYRSGHGLR